MIELTDDDVLTAPTPVIPVNLVGVMGKGLALAARKRWPDLLKTYRQALRERTLTGPGRNVLGQLMPARVHVWETNGQRVVLAATKQHWRAPSPPELVRATIDALGNAVKAAGGREINVPPIGCGLGGLSHELVKPWVLKAAEAHPNLIWRLHRWRG